MGIECTLSEINNVWKSYSHYPIISILRKNIILKKFSDFSCISLGKDLSAALINYSKTNRKNFVIRELSEIIKKETSEHFMITDIDVLFNPEYNIDILGYFINISRNKKVLVFWPGGYDSGILSYASSGYTDYKRYLLKDYNIILLR